MYSIIKQNDNNSYGLNQYVCDTEEDVQNLPTNIKIHSIALVINSGRIYILNGEKKWVKFGGN